MNSTFPRLPSEAFLKTASHTVSHHETSTSSALVLPRSIAVSREAGALGSSGAQEVSRRLGWQLYDQKLLDLIAADMGLGTSHLESVDERPGNWVREWLEGFCSKPGLSSCTYLHRLVSTIRSLAAQGNCIIVGRGAAHLLPTESTLRVRLVAPRAFRVATIQTSRGMTAEEAERWIDATDQDRSKFVKEYPGKDPTDPRLYDLVLNVSRFSVPRLAELIVDALPGLEELRTRQ